MVQWSNGCQWYNGTVVHVEWLRTNLVCLELVESKILHQYIPVASPLAPLKQSHSPPSQYHSPFVLNHSICAQTCTTVPLYHDDHWSHYTIIPLHHWTTVLIQITVLSPCRISRLYKHVPLPGYKIESVCDLSISQVFG